jgi:hypothetical protein
MSERIHSDDSLGTVCSHGIGDPAQLAQNLVPRSTDRTAAAAKAMNA